MTDLTKNEETGVAVVPDYGDVTETGFENQTMDDRSTPYLTLLQQNSPQCRDAQDGGIEGAKPGMFMNSATQELYDGRDAGVLVVPAYTQHLYIEYRPREEGGGFVGVHQADSEVVREAKSRATAFNRLTVGGNDLTEAFYVFCALTDSDGEPIGGIVIPFTSTKIKAYKKWNTRVSTLLLPRADGRRATPPIFAHLVRVKSSLEENQHGKFFGMSLSPAVDGDLKASLLPRDDPRFVAAHELMKSVSSGDVKAAGPSGQNSEGGGGASDDTPF